MHKVAFCIHFSTTACCPCLTFSSVCIKHHPCTWLGISFFDSKHWYNCIILHNVLLLTCSVSYLLFWLWIYGMLYKISYHIISYHIISNEVCFMIYFILIQTLHFVGLKKTECKKMHGMNNTKCTIWTTQNAQYEQHKMHGMNNTKCMVWTTQNARYEQHKMHGMNNTKCMVWTTQNA